MERIFDPGLSQPFIAAFLENAPSAIAMFDRDMNYLMATRRWMTDYGLEGQDLVGRCHYDIFPEIPERWRALHRRTLEGETLSAEADAFARADGSVTYVRWRNVPWRDADGVVGGMVMFTEVVTDQVLAAEETRRKTEWLELTEKIGRIGHWRVDLRAGDVFWSDQVYRIHGLDPAEFSPDLDSALEFYHPEDRAEVERAIAAAMEAAAPFAFELRLVRPDGQERWVASRGECRVDDNGAVVALFGTFQDVTARRQREAEVRESEERFALAVNASAAGIWDWSDLSSVEGFWSDQFYRLLGYQPGEIAPSADTFREKILHPDDRESVSAALDQHIAGGEPYRVEHRLRGKDGRYRWYLGTGQAVWDSEGQPRRMIGSIMDIHDRKAAEELKSEFVSTVSHELRTPMTSIMGALGLVQSGACGEISPKARELLGIAKGNGDRLVRLINDILDVEKIEGGRIEMRRGVVAAADLVRDAVEQNAAFVAGRGARLSVDDRSDGACILADPDRIIQVLTNLISNAAKFSGDEGRIDIALRAGDGAVTVAVRDNGPGIPAAHLDAVFDRFMQIDSGDTRANQEGAGLGLSISRAIVKAHGGKIRADSPSGGGALFTIELPRAQPDQDAGDPARSVLNLLRAG